MTGFARKEASDGDTSWVWEMRSVNGKSLDLRFRMPSGLEAIEPQLREIAAKKLKRGNVQITLTMESGGGNVVPVLNQAAFDAATDMARNAAKRADLPMPGLEVILGIKGVVELAEPAEDEAVRAARNLRIIESFEETVASLASARQAEGASMGSVLAGQIDRIEQLKDEIKAAPSRSTEAIREKLGEQLSRLLEQSDGIDPQRLHQEAAILATKSDLQEEIDRLESHIGSARSLIASDEAIGRKLDFLAQEFNRECNTICSKSNASSVTTAGLEMKVVIDQFREQVQNIQ